ncbi:MAG: hypothetical protein ABJP34_07395 [Erythrobacter sp.]
MNIRNLASPAALAIALSAMPLAAPAAASGTQNLNPSKVCFVNKSGQRLYFRAVYDGVTKGGVKLGNGAKFCSSNPAPAAIQISLERKSPVLCRNAVKAGRTYTLNGPPQSGKCLWSASAH